MSALRGYSCSYVNLLWVALFAVCAGSGAAFAEGALQPNEIAGRCWTLHVLYGERMRVGSPSAEIAAENAAFWRTHAASEGQSEAELDAALSANLELAREHAARMPGGGLMDILLNTTICQTLRADIQPGYDPVQQNRGS